jgi:hypothetical protein
MDKFPVFWVDNLSGKDRLTAEYRALMCAIQSHMLSMWEYPAVDPTKHYGPGTIVVIVTPEANVFGSANATMTKAGMPLRLLNETLISGEDIGKPAAYWLTITEVLAGTAATGEQKR